MTNTQRVMILSGLGLLAGCGSAGSAGSDGAATTMMPAAAAPMAAAKSSQPAAAGGTAGNAAPAAASMATDPAVTGMAALPATPPATPSYVVPVANAELQPYATFDVGRVWFSVSGTKVKMQYDFPEALSGVAKQGVSFDGSVVEPGVAQLNGAPGSARCVFSDTVASCSEMMTGLATDPARAQALLQTQALSDMERALRGQVIAGFAVDPIGVLTFARHSDD